MATIDRSILEERTRCWDVVLVSAVKVPEPRRWTFARDGIEFVARMQDAAVLDALRDSSFGPRLTKGAAMRVMVTYLERCEGSEWLPVKYSHRVIEVVEPRPPAFAA